MDTVLQDKFPVKRLAAFSEGDFGGNPAGVVICEALPDASVMQAIAAQVGYSETAFAAPVEGAWRVRYFAPEIEVPRSSDYFKSIMPMSATDAIGRKIIAIDCKYFARFQCFGR